MASALYLALLFSNCSNAQVDSATGNLINYTGSPTDTTSTWNNGVYVNQLTCWAGGQPGNCGPYPSVRPGGLINFSYGTVDLNQVVNINRALAAGGSGVQLSGFNFSFMAKNGNGWDDGRQDYLAAYVKFYNAGGSLAANYDYTSQTNQRYNWTAFNFSETFANPTAASNYSNAQVGFVGRDNNFWAGTYGPEVYNVAFSLKYRVDPCSTNPAYSPNCAGFKDVLTSSNLVSNPNGYAVFGDSINQSYAINTALANAGSGAVIHGFQWGYVANANGPYCAFMFIGCWDQRDPSVTTNVNITNASGASLYNVTREYRNSYNTTEYSYLFPTSQQMSTLGNFNFTASTNDAAYVGSMWSRALYTADPCAVNPLSSPTCSGYAVAFAKTITATAPPAPAPPPPELAAAAPALAEASPTQSAPPPSAPPPPAPVQDTAVAQADPAQPSPTQPGPAPTGSPAPAGGPPQTVTASSSSSSSSSSPSSSAGPSKLAMSVLKSAQEKDKATQNAAVASAAKTLEGSMQSSQASSNAAISMNQDMSANSAVAAATFSSQTTQASQQTSTQSNQPQQAVQTSTQTQQTSRQGPQVQQQQQDTQQAAVQSASIVQYQPPQQQETQQSQTQTSTSVVKLLPPQQQEQQQTQSQMTAGMMTAPQSTYTPPQQQPQDTQSTQVAMLKPPTPPVVEIQQQASIGTGITVGRNLFAYNPLMSFNSSSMSTMPQQSQPMYQPRLDTKQFEVEAPQMPIASFSGSRAGNPLSEIIMQQRFEMMQNNISQPGSSVNKNVQPNEIAGGVDIASMASVPTGFSAYSFVLKDAAFYEPKEVYKNQRTVDNERVLRGLTRGSDSLHQQMVDQQYKIGN